MMQWTMWKNCNNWKRMKWAYSLHDSTLAEYLKVQRIPKGLRSSLTPILKDYMEYQEKWCALCNWHSLHLMLLTVASPASSNKTFIYYLDTKDYLYNKVYTWVEEKMKSRGFKRSEKVFSTDGSLMQSDKGRLFKPPGIYRQKEGDDWNIFFRRFRGSRLPQ